MRKKVLENLVQECQEDHVGFWRIVNAVRFDLGSMAPAQTQALTLELVRSLLQEREMQVGWPDSDGRYILAWNLTPDQAIHRIEKEGAALGCGPKIGELAWFTSAE